MVQSILLHIVFQCGFPIDRLALSNITSWLQEEKNGEKADVAYVAGSYQWVPIVLGLDPHRRRDCLKNVVRQACPEPAKGLTSSGGGFSPAHPELVEG